MIKINLIRGMEKEVKRQQRLAYFLRYRREHQEYLRKYDRERGERPRSPEAMARRREKSKIRNRKWFQKNKKRHRESGAEWKRKNRERSRQLSRRSYLRHQTANVERNRRYRAANPSKGVENATRWNKAHPEQYKANKKLNEQKRRARKLKAIGTHTRDQWLARIEYYGWCCAYCRKPLTAETVRKDHRIALTRGGTDHASNLVPACHSCNSRKHTKTPREFAAVK